MLSFILETHTHTCQGFGGCFAAKQKVSICFSFILGTPTHPCVYVSMCICVHVKDTYTHIDGHIHTEGVYVSMLWVFVPRWLCVPEWS